MRKNSLEYKITIHNWKDLQNFIIENNLSSTQFHKETKLGRKLIDYAIKLKLINFDHYTLKHSEETKIKQSKKRKKYLKENPDKHIWKKNTKFKSNPCELFKDKLKENNITFVEEFTPLIDRSFSIDICFPDKKIGIEINGNQHYNSDGTLKPYYQERHDLIEKEGWKIFEYHYSMPYNEFICNEIINKLKIDYNLSEVDYSFYIKKNNKQFSIKKNKYVCVNKDICECGKEKDKSANYCMECSKYNSRKIKERPSIEILLKEVDEHGYNATGRKYDVSDTTIKKWLKGFTKPMREYNRNGKPKCLDCNIEIDYGNTRCRECYNKSNIKYPCPDLNNFYKLYQENNSSTKCSKIYNVSRTVIYRWLKEYKKINNE